MRRQVQPTLRQSQDFETTCLLVVVHRGQASATHYTRLGSRDAFAFVFARPTHQNLILTACCSKHFQTMSDGTSTPAPAPAHEPPSLPSSPLPKRTKIIDPTPLNQPSTLPRNNDSGAATPTPLASSHMAALPPHAPIAPSIAAGAAAEQALQVLLLSETAKAPTKGSQFAAGHDLYSAKDTVIPARGRAIVATDISISVPVGTCAPLKSS